MTRPLPLLALLACLLLAACAALPRGEAATEVPGIVIDGIVFRNELPFPVTDVMVNVPATGGFAGCGLVMARSECSTSFESVDYRAHPMMVSWKEYGEAHRTGEFVLELPPGADPARPAWVEVRIFSMGEAGAVLKQH